MADADTAPNDPAADVSAPNAAAPSASAVAALADAETEFHRLIADFKSFQERIDMKLKTQDDRISMIDRKSATRPALARVAEEQDLHRKALAAYLRRGDDADLRGLRVERKTYTAAVAGEGGFLVDADTAGSIAKVLEGAGSIRSVASVVQIEAAAYESLIDLGEIGTDWVAETPSTATTAAPAATATTADIRKIVVPLHELAATPRASQRLLDDSAFDIESWLAERIAERFARAENAAFVNGDGVDKPRGFLSVGSAPAAAATWGQLGYVATGAAGAFDATDPADALVELVYSLGAGYRRNAVFAMNSQTAGAVRRMKDAEGRFLWSESLGGEEPARLLGFPVLTVEDMPDIGADAMAVAFGDFAAGYTIAERPDIRILRDPYSDKPNVQFFARARVGGDVSDFSAIRLLKFGVS